MPADLDAIPEIDVHEAKLRHDAGEALFLDVRDAMSYRAARVPGARRVDDATIEAFLRETARDQPIVIYCYHGHSSLGGAAYLIEQGFREVRSLTGGFEAWRGTYPHESS